MIFFCASHAEIEQGTYAFWKVLFFLKSVWSLCVCVLKTKSSVAHNFAPLHKRMKHVAGEIAGVHLCSQLPLTTLPKDARF